MSRRKVHEEVLRRNSVNLTKNLKLEPLWSHLYEKGIFDEIWIEIIQGTGPQNAPAQRSRLITDLAKLGPDKWERFISALYASGQNHIADTLKATQRQVEHERGIVSQGPVEGTAYQESHHPQGGAAYGAQPQIIKTEHTPQAMRTGSPRTTPKSVHPTNSPVPGGANAYLAHPHQVAAATLGYPPHNPGRVPQEGVDDKHMQTDANITYDQYYTVDSNPRGLLLIINNRDFEAEHLETRKGTEKDEENLKTTFDRFGFFLYDVRRNLTAAEISKTVTDFASYEAHRNVDSCALVILTHGCEEGVYGVDGKKVHVRDIVGSFNLVENSPLYGKPKLIVFGACRGEGDDTGVLRPDAPGLPGGPGRHLPTNSDILVSYATSEGLASWRHENKGSIFIQAFCEIFDKCSFTKHVLDMLVMVNNMVSDWNIRLNAGSKLQIQKQLPQQVVGLRKAWMLNPPPPYPSS